MEPFRIETRRDPAAVDAILRSLPQWFGDETAIGNYVASAAVLESHLAIRDGSVIGVALVERHFPESAELALIAVHAEERGRGIGTALVNAVVDATRADGAALLQVRTVGASFDDAGYAETRAFYRGLGFVPLQEFAGIDWDGPTLISAKILAP